ncbi:unnamed protein product [Discosporangium mesarthrocarpum]
MGTSTFKFDGSPDAAIIKKVCSWFVNPVKDQDVIDLKILVNIVASIGAAVDSLETFFAKHEFHELMVIEVGVIRYPDIEYPYFKVYRIKLTAWSDSSRVLPVWSNKNGMTGEFLSRKFQPRASVMAGLKGEKKEKAIEEAENLFGW